MACLCFDYLWISFLCILHKTKHMDIQVVDKAKCFKPTLTCACNYSGWLELYRLTVGRVMLAITASTKLTREWGKCQSNTVHIVLGRDLISENKWFTCVGLTWVCRTNNEIAFVINNILGCFSFNYIVAMCMCSIMSTCAPGASALCFIAVRSQIPPLLFYLFCCSQICSARCMFNWNMELRASIHRSFRLSVFKTDNLTHRRGCPLCEPFHWVSPSVQIYNCVTQPTDPRSVS